MSKFKCEDQKDKMCSTRDYGWNEYKDPCYHCCINCQHAIDMSCSIVCSKVAEYLYPEE